MGRRQKNLREPKLRRESATLKMDFTKSNQKEEEVKENVL